MEPDVTEFKILKYLLGETRVDRIRTEYITERATVGWFGDKVREARLRVTCADREGSGYIG